MIADREARDIGGAARHITSVCTGAFVLDASITVTGGGGDFVMNSVNVVAGLPIAAGTVLLKKYRVEKLIGEGGTGIVVVAAAGNFGSDGNFTITSPGNSTEFWLVETVRKQAEKAGIAMPEVAIYDDTGAKLSGTPLRVAPTTQTPLCALMYCTPATVE